LQHDVADQLLQIGSRNARGLAVEEQAALLPQRDEVQILFMQIALAGDLFPQLHQRAFPVRDLLINAAQQQVGRARHQDEQQDECRQNSERQRRSEDSSPHHGRFSASGTPGTLATIENVSALSPSSRVVGAAKRTSSNSLVSSSTL